jgi:ABC-type sugar transport system ATPase subunit
MNNKMKNREVVLETKGLSKHFGGVKAIDNIDLKLYKNEIIAIVGDNGAGKSTFIKTISGVHRKDHGNIHLFGKEVDIHNPSDSRRLGIETVYQDGGVVPMLNASLNLFLGREKVRKGILGKALRMVDYRYMRNETVDLLDRVGIGLKDVDAELNNLSGGQRQSVVVGRAVYWGGKILIFDEPTNNLGAKQERIIIDLIKSIRDKYDVSIIIISHNIMHVFELVDRIIVLRNGCKVGERMKEETDPNEIISMITGVSNN